MDTTKLFIKMSDCPEIQYNAPMVSYNRCVYHLLQQHFFADGEGNVFLEDGGYYFGSCGDKLIWLPRQDQLQKMLYGDAGMESCVSLANDISKFGKSLGRKHVEKYQFQSMEQLWLAFFMWQKYSKTWNGEVWEQ